MPQAKVLSPAELKRVLGAAESTQHAARNRLALLLSFLGGLRVGEIAKLRLGDVLAPDGSVASEIWLSRDQTKGSKGRVVYLSEKLKRELTGYVAELGNQPPAVPLIPSQRSNRHFSNSSLGMLFRALFERAGIRTTSHAGRRTFATRLNEQGVGMRTIQTLMGHKHISTTAIYCDVSEKTLRKVVNLVG